MSTVNVTPPQLRFAKTATKVLVGFILLSGLFSLGGGLGLLGLAAFLLRRGLNIEQIPLLAAVEGGVLLLVGAFTLLTGHGLQRRRRWAWPAAVILCVVVLTLAGVRLESELTLYHGLSFGLNLFLLGLLFLPGVRRSGAEGLEPPNASTINKLTDPDL